LRKMVALLALAGLLLSMGALAAPEAGLGDRQLRAGMRGPDVALLQRILNNLGYQAGTEDGIFGPRTEAAVRAFQKDHRLPAIGVVGPRTTASLQASSVHRVKAGENLSSIANRYGIDPGILARFNQLSNPDLLLVGQELRIPGGEAPVNKGTPAAPAPTPAPSVSTSVPARPTEVKLTLPYPPPDKVIALTLDDGPEPRSTPRILDILNQYGAKATFFVIGRKVESHPDVVKRIIRDGSEVANHSYSHLTLANLPTRQIAEELEKAGDIIEQVTGRKATFFRPPGGVFDRMVVVEAGRLGYRVVMWSNLGHRGGSNLTESLLQSSFDGAVIMLHDNAATVALLPTLLEGWKRKGYRVVTLSEAYAIRSGVLPLVH